MKNYLLLLILASIGFGTSCTKEKPICCGPSPVGPNSAIRIGFDDSSKFLSLMGSFADSLVGNHIPVLDSMANYPENSTPTFEAAYARQLYDSSGNRSYPYYVLELHMWMNTISPNQPQQVWHLDWPNGKADTLFLHFDEANTHLLKDITLNNSQNIQKTDYSMNGVFVFM